MSLIRIHAKDAVNHIGEHVVMTDSMYGYRSSKDSVLVDLGNKYPHQLITDTTEQQQQQAAYWPMLMKCLGLSVHPFTLHYAYG